MFFSVNHFPIALMTISVGCGVEIAPTEKVDPDDPPRQLERNTYDLIPPQSNQSLSDLCRATGGHWHHALKACHCAQNYIFSVCSGCRPIDAGTTFANTRIKFPGTLLFSLDPDLRSAGFSLARSEVDTSFLSGYQFDDADNNGLAEVEIAEMSPLRLDNTLDELLNSPESVASTTHGWSSRQHDFLSFDDLLTRCGSLGRMVGRNDSQSWSPFCTAAAYAVYAIQSDSLPPTEWHSKKLGLGPKSLYYEVGAFQSMDSDITYKITGKKNTPINRKISMTSASGIVAEVALSPSGAIFGGRISYSEAESAQSPWLYQAHKVYFEGPFSFVSKQVASRGDRARLQRGLWEASHLGKDLKDSLLPHELGSAFPGPVRAMILEGEVDLRIPALARRFVLDERVVEDFVTTGSLPRSVFVDESLPRSLESMAASPMANHGTNVAAVLLAGLPDVQTFLVDVNTRVPRNAAKLRDMLDSRIGKRQPRVVNISRSFHGAIGACEDAFDPVFLKYRDDVLFVVAAGNYGEEDSPGICPASLAWKHSNVLSVAGTDGRGKIHRRSNWGSKGANIAAPYCAQTLDPLADDNDQLSIVEACGTSISAPLVGNAALKAFATNPRMTAPEVATLLKSSDFRAGEIAQ